MIDIQRITQINHGLRDYQIEAKQNIYESWQDQNRSVLLQMPTGTGKTRLFCSIVREFNNLAMESGFNASVMVVAHREELILQIQDNLTGQYHIHSGIIKAGYPYEPTKPTQIASIQTLSNRKIKKNISLIIIDEAHHASATTYRKLWDEFPDALILGVTATPYRLDGSGLHDLFDDLITSPNIPEFIRKGYLANVKYFAVPDAKLPDFSKIRTTAGDYDTEDLMHAVGEDPLIQSRLVDSYKRFVEGKKGIVYTINQKHNEIVKEAYDCAGIKAEIVDSTTPALDRRRIIADFKANRIKVLCNVDIFTEGFDCPDIDFVQLARPTKSLTKYLQQVGRCMRPAPDKSYGLVLDNVGMYKEHGIFSNTWDWESYFYGSSIVASQGVNGGCETRDTQYEIDILEGDEEMVWIKTDIQVDLISDDEHQLFDFFNNLLRERFNLLVNLGYSQNKVYEAIKIFHTEEYLESEGVYLEYKKLLENLIAKSKQIIDTEQELFEYESTIDQLKDEKRPESIAEFLEDYDEILKYYNALIGVFPEKKVISNLTVLFPEEILKANFELAAAKSKNKEAEILEIQGKIQHKKSRLELHREEEQAIRKEINDFIQGHHPSQYQVDESPKETEIRRLNPESFSVNEAFQLLRQELFNLEHHNIVTQYRNMSSGMIQRLDRFVKMVKEHRIPNEKEKTEIKKLLLKQMEKGYVFKEKGIIKLLTRRWVDMGYKESMEKTQNAQAAIDISDSKSNPEKFEEESERLQKDKVMWYFNFPEHGGYCVSDNPDETAIMSIPIKSGDEQGALLMLFDNGKVNRYELKHLAHIKKNFPYRPVEALPAGILHAEVIIDEKLIAISVRIEGDEFKSIKIHPTSKLYSSENPLAARSNVSRHVNEIQYKILDNGLEDSLRRLIHISNIAFVSVRNPEYEKEWQLLNEVSPELM